MGHHITRNWYVTALYMFMLRRVMNHSQPLHSAGNYLNKLFYSWNAYVTQDELDQEICGV